MGNSVTRTDFEWVTQEEPHAKRRTEILSRIIILKLILEMGNEYICRRKIWEVFSNSVTEKYPQIKKLFGVDSTFKWKVCCLVLVQFVMLYVMKNQPWMVVVLAGYLFGGVINHALMLGTLFIKHFFNIIFSSFPTM